MDGTRWIPDEVFEEAAGVENCSSRAMLFLSNRNLLASSAFHFVSDLILGLKFSRHTQRKQQKACVANSSQGKWGLFSRRRWWRISGSKMVLLRVKTSADEGPCFEIFELDISYPVPVVRFPRPSSSPGSSSQVDQKDWRWVEAGDHIRIQDETLTLVIERWIRISVRCRRISKAKM